MNAVQLGAFVNAFGELWEAQRESQERVKDLGDPFSGKVGYTFQAIGVLAAIAWSADWKWAAMILFVVWLTWFGSAWDDARHAKAAADRLEQIRWKEFDLRFQWRAFGLWDEHLAELKALWNPSGYLDLDSPDYRQWWDRAIATANERQQLSR